MKHYKRVLLKKLSDSGWELVSQDSDTEWWLEEAWTIKSVQINWGYELLILFLVDLQYDGTDKSQATWAIAATKQMPTGYTEAEEDAFAFMNIKGDFDQQASEFIAVLNRRRTQQASRNRQLMTVWYRVITIFLISQN